MKKCYLRYAFTVICLAFTVAAGAASAITTATIQISPKSESILVATVNINWAPQSIDKLAVKWTRPDNALGGSCHNSLVKIKPGITQFHSIRTPWYADANGAPVVCKGTWTASVIDLVTGRVLNTAKYVVTL